VANFFGLEIQSTRDSNRVPAFEGQRALREETQTGHFGWRWRLTILQKNLQPWGQRMNSHASISKTDWDRKADLAIAVARSMAPGPHRQTALKKAGYLRLMADLVSRIRKLETPVRGKKPSSSKRRGHKALTERSQFLEA
jgi:hypothetical protein